jgi:hypothetical protein
MFSNGRPYMATTIDGHDFGLNVIKKMVPY